MNENIFCFDLDGTLTTIEILPCIAAELGVSEEIDTLTRHTMSGLIPFEDSLRLRALILGQVPLSRIHEIMQEIPISSELFEFIHSHTSNCYIITGNLDVWIDPLIKKIGCQSYTSSAQFDGNILRLKKILNKGTAVNSIRAKHKNSRIISVGDGANDVPMFESSDLAIAYGGVHTPAVSAVAVSDLVVHNMESLCKLLKGL